jgi:hypothetical protein
MVRAPLSDSATAAYCLLHIYCLLSFTYHLLSTTSYFLTTAYSLLIGAGPFLSHPFVHDQTQALSHSGLPLLAPSLMSSSTRTPPYLHYTASGTSTGLLCCTFSSLHNHPYLSSPSPAAGIALALGWTLQVVACFPYSHVYLCRIGSGPFFSPPLLYPSNQALSHNVLSGTVTVSILRRADSTV